ncbi:hypothetical protein C2S52_009020 [Perilla frutescens var. hirtella]|nr:hypothetical protein C2S52_009020 [Perilla frutescens var. hirtella]
MLKEGEEEPASPSARLMQAPQFNLCIISAMGYYTKIDANLYKKCIQQTLLKHPRFSSILVTNNGKCSWKRTKVDVENHVFAMDLDPDMDSPDKFVENYATNLSGTPMDLTKPLWEIHILNVKTSDASSTALFKIHHSMGDGVSLMALCHACSRKINDPDSLPVFPLSEKHNRAVISDRGLIMNRFWGFVWTVMLVAFYTLMDITAFIATLWLVRDAKTPIKVEHGGAPQSQKRFVHRVVNLDDVKLIKTALNVSINDVVLGVTEAGISRYLNARYEKINENGAEIININGANSLPKSLRLRSTVVFNLRPSPTIKDLADMMEKEELKGMWGNLIGIVILPLKIDMLDNPLTYIRRAKSMMDRKKLSLGHKCAFLVMKLTMSLFGIKAAAAMTSAVFRNTTLTFSNVMGPKEEVNLFGHHLSYIAPSVYGFPQSLVVHHQSYADRLIISIGADEKLIPNPYQLCDDLVKSLQNIKEAVMKLDGNSLC